MNDNDMFRLIVGLPKICKEDIKRNKNRKKFSNLRKKMEKMNA